MTSKSTDATVVDQLMRRALHCHRTQDFKSAESLYREILMHNPLHGDASHNLGVLAAQIGQVAQGIPYLLSARKIDPTHVRYLISYVDALLSVGRVDEAKEEIDQSNYSKDVSPEIRALTKRVQAALGVSKDLSPAEKSNLIALFNSNEIWQMENLAEQLVLAHPYAGFAWKALGTAQQMLKKPAINALQKAASLMPDDAECFNNLGNAQRDMGLLTEAIQSYRVALQINPNFADAYGNLGCVLRDSGQPHEAVGYIEKSLSLKPDNPTALGNLGAALADLGRLPAAIESYLKAVSIAPTHADLYCGLGAAYRNKGNLREAERYLRLALSLEPSHAMVNNNLATVLQDLGDSDSAEDCYREAIAVNPAFAAAHSNLLFLLANKESCSAEDYLEEANLYKERFQSPLESKWIKHATDRSPRKLLNIGFVSGDFRNHAVAGFFELVASKLAEQAEIVLHAYYNHWIEDEVTARIQKSFNTWRKVAGRSEQEVFNQIVEDKIDILVDLSGHTVFNLLPVFARKPAPIQVTWMGFPSTTGLSAIDYYISDPIFLPEGRFDDQFVEKIVRLPASAPFLPNITTPPVSALPARKNGYLTLGSFNRITKINRSVVSMWSAVLRDIPTAKMLVAGLPESGPPEFLKKWFFEEGVDITRLSFHSACGMHDYLQLHDGIDICLDTFPYNGGTTSLWAAWMGVPTLTVSGNTAASRTGASINGHLVLQAYCATDAKDFLQKGVELASHWDELESLRQTLRSKLIQSPIGQPELIANSFSSALRTMWTNWRAGDRPKAFNVGTPST